MKRFSFAAALALLAIVPAVPHAQPADSSDAARLRDAVKVFDEVMSAED